MKTLTTDFENEKQKKTAIPINIVKFVFDTGDYYCSDRQLVVPVGTEDELVVDWGDILHSSWEEKGVVGDTNLTLSDQKNVLYEKMRGESFYKKECIVYQWFEGLAWADAIVLFSGTIVSAVRNEEDVTINFNVTNRKTKDYEKWGDEATEEIFPNICRGLIGNILPLVIGTVERSMHAIQVVCPVKSSIATHMTWDADFTTLVDGKYFPQDTAFDFFIGQELCRGKVNGNKVTLYQRGKIIKYGYTFQESATVSTVQIDLDDNGPGWAGYKIKFWNKQQWVYCKIINHTTPYTYGITPPLGPFKAGVYYEVYTEKDNHDAGETFVEKLDEYVWIVNNAESNEITNIELPGNYLNINDVSVKTMLSVLEDATINLSDSTWSGDLGHNVTSITLPYDPSTSIAKAFESNDLQVSMTGINYSNPIDIIVYLAQKIGFTYPDDFDTSSETAVKALISWVEYGFVITSKFTYTYLQELAFQARITFAFIGDVVKFYYLRNGFDEIDLRITDLDRQFDSVQVYEKKEVYNKIRVAYTEKDHIEYFTVKDDASIAKYGERETELNLWAIRKKYIAEGIAKFWLRRWKDQWHWVLFRAFLNIVEVEPEDWLSLTFKNFFNDQPARVKEVNNLLGSIDGIDLVQVSAQLPYDGGCSSSCEAFEETGCASTCEQYCTISEEVDCGYDCETSDQGPCSLICVTSCELYCTGILEVGDNGCRSWCQTSDVTGDGDTDCETGCRIGCQGGCTTGDEGCATVCMISCTGGSCTTYKEGCTGTCQTGCTYGSCETSCTQSDTSCWTACMNDCTTNGCTSSCQTPCTTGAEGCSACCENVCTGTSCRSLCTAGSCRAGCTADVTAEGTTTCSDSCESACQAECEGACQSCCRVDGTETGNWKCTSSCQGTGCMANCETNDQTSLLDIIGAGPCVTGCQATCMTSGTTGCAEYCTVSCECYCMLNCESNCQTTSCQTACQCLCKTAGNQVCSTTSEGGCFTGCQEYCKSNDTISACYSACQCFCTTGCTESCEALCTLGCQCNCQKECECNCTTGCEASCTCGACQTSCMFAGQP